MNPVEPYKTKYVPANALLCALCAKAVYKDNADEIRQHLEEFVNSQEGLNLNEVHHFKVGPSFAAIIDFKECLVWAFRGTDDLRDWLDNLDIRDDDGALGEVHNGFKRALDRVWHLLEPKANSLQGDDRRPTFITGHSLGGAMASLAAGRFLAKDHAFTSCYTFGAPRSYDRNSSERYNNLGSARTHRFCNNNDIVTRVPARLAGFRHVGSLRYIDEGGQIHDDPGYWFQFIDKCTGAVEAVREKVSDGIDISDFAAVIQDHDMKNYVNAIVEEIGSK